MTNNPMTYPKELMELCEKVLEISQQEWARDEKPYENFQELLNGRITEGLTFRQRRLDRLAALLAETWAENRRGIQSWRRVCERLTRERDALRKAVEIADRLYTICTCQQGPVDAATINETLRQYDEAQRGLDTQEDRGDEET